MKKTPSVKKKSALSPILLVAIVLLVAGVIAWQFYKYKILNHGIAKAFAEKTDHQYTLQYDHIVLDELKGTLQIKNIYIQADSEASSKKQSVFLRRLSIGELDIVSVKTPKAILNKQIEGGKIELLYPTIELVMGDLPMDTDLTRPYVPVYKELLGNFLQIKFDSIQISHAHLLVRNSKNAIAYEAKDVSISLGDLKIDSNTNNESARILFSKHFDITCGEFKFPTNDHQYRFSIDSLHLSNLNNSLHVGKIHIAATLPEEAFSKAFRMDRFDFLLEGIQLLHINMERLWLKQIEADELVINKSSFKIYWDLANFNDSLKKEHRYPQKQIQDLPIPILIRKATLVHSFIEYKEKNPKSDTSGKLQFFQVHGTVNNITNRPDAISKNNKCIIFINAKLMDQLGVNAKVTLLLRNPNGNFMFEGDTKAIAVSALNPISVPMGLTRLERGNINKCHFDFAADDSSSTGKISLLYDDLKITLLKENRREEKDKRKVIPSLVSNIIIRKSNPGKGGNQRTADVHFKWKESKSFLNVIWNSIFLGLKKSIGIDKYL
jgi:hypothetical protein